MSGKKGRKDETLTCSICHTSYKESEGHICKTPLGDNSNSKRPPVTGDTLKKRPGGKLRKPGKK